VSSQEPYPGPYTVEFDPRARKELDGLDKPVARRVAIAVAALRTDPRPSGSRPLSGHPNLRRLRVGDYRVVYTIRDAELLVLALRVAHRSVAYRKL